MRTNENNVVYVGMAGSIARFKQAAISNGCPVCGSCIKEHKQHIEPTTIVNIGLDECYCCEQAKDNCYLLLN